MYIKQADFIHDDLRKLIVFFKQNRTDVDTWEANSQEFNKLLAVNLRELLGLVRRVRQERFDIKNKKAVTMRLGSISDDIQKFLLEYGIIVKRRNSVEIKGTIQ